MVYGIVRQSGGYIWVESELELGTSFQILFPAVDEVVSIVELDQGAPVPGQGETILLAEDEVALRESIAAYLVQHGYNVLEASNGEEALQVAGRFSGQDSPAADRCCDAEGGRRRTGQRTGQAARREFPPFLCRGTPITACWSICPWCADPQCCRSLCTCTRCWKLSAKP